VSDHHHNGPGFDFCLHQLTSALSGEKKIKIILKIIPCNSFVCSLVEKRVRNPAIMAFLQSRKESKLNYLLMGNRSFVNTRDSSRKLIGRLGVRQLKLAQMPKQVRMKTNNSSLFEMTNILRTLKYRKVKWRELWSLSVCYDTLSAFEKNNVAKTYCKMKLCVQKYKYNFS